MKKALFTAGIVIMTVLLATLLFGYMKGHGTERDPEHKDMVGCGMMKGHGMKGCCPKGGDWGMMMNYMKGAKFYLKFEEKIGLSESQVEKLKTISNEGEKGAIKIKAELKTLMVDFKSVLDEDKIDLSQVKSLITKIANLKAKLHFAKLEASVRGKEVLNTKQLKQLESLMKEFHKKKAAHGCSGMKK